MILNPEFRSVRRAPRAGWRALAPGIAALTMLLVLGGLRMQQWQSAPGVATMPVSAIERADRLAPAPVEPIAAVAEVSRGSIESRQATIDAMLSMHPLLFDSRAVRLSPDDRAWVAELAERLAGSDDRIHVRGHSDRVGTPARRERVSLERARMVSEALVASGVAPSRIVVEAWGAHLPVDSEASEAGRARNRRVDLVLSKGGEQ